MSSRVTGQRIRVSDLVGVSHAVRARAEGADPLGRKGAFLLRLRGESRQTCRAYLVELAGAGAVSFR